MYTFVERSHYRIMTQRLPTSYICRLISSLSNCSCVNTLMLYDLFCLVSFSFGGILTYFFNLRVCLTNFRPFFFDDFCLLLGFGGQLPPVPPVASPLIYGFCMEVCYSKICYCNDLLVKINCELYFPNTGISWGLKVKFLKQFLIKRNV